MQSCVPIFSLVTLKCNTFSNLLAYHTKTQYFVPQVVILTMLADQSTHPNITEINFVFRDNKSDTFNMFDHINDNTGGFSLIKTFMPKMAREIYKLPPVKNLYDRRKDFDLIIISNLFSEVSVGVKIPIRRFFSSASLRHEYTLSLTSLEIFFVDIFHSSL